MDIKEIGIAGTLESSDIMIKVESSDTDTISITLQSSVEKQYGSQIRRVILETARELGLVSAAITAVDKGALDCTVRARTAAAIYRACQSSQYDWGGSKTR